MNNGTRKAIPPLPLDNDLYHLEPDESEFLKKQTNIQDEAELKHHTLSIQKEAYGVRLHLRHRFIHDSY